MSADAATALSACASRIEALLAACDDATVRAAWTQSGGPAATRVRTSLFGISLRIMSSDGAFEQPEVDLFNQLFSTSHTIESLRELYRNLAPFAGGSIEDEALALRDALNAAQDGLGEQYRSATLALCEFLSQSDGNEEWAERDLATRLKDALA